MPDASGSGVTGNPIADLAIVLLLILVGGFFAASEIALITVKRHRLNQLIGEGSGAAERRPSIKVERPITRSAGLADTGSSFWNCQESGPATDDR